MKKIYTLLFSTATLFSIANAQTNTDLQFKKGDKLLGGSISSSLQRTTYNTSTPSVNPSYDLKYYSLSISPSLGFFTKPNQLTGISLLFNYGSSAPSNAFYKDKSYTYGAGFYRQYWNSLGKNFYFIFQGKAGGNYGYASSEASSTKYETKSGTAYFTIDPGLAYRMKKRLILDVYFANFLYSSFGYGERRTNGGLATRDYTFAATTGLKNFSLESVVFGFRYLL